ncbi:MAG: hypothetical protein NC420_15710, partial [Eubacterium sp.]|nr:hypothetical protein [Eubacterium sp.]
NSKSHTEESQEQRFFRSCTDSSIVCAAMSGMSGSVRRVSSRSQQRLLRGETLSLTRKNRKSSDSSGLAKVHGLFVPPQAAEQAFALWGSL